jgi:DNA polymerase-3 subunit gamma/tau
MGQALYRKYRSKTLNEVIGQEHITRTLGEALKQGRISHAYLFTGPRGVGKTSVARILAHEINGLPYTDDSVHMDIIEIDAASNRRIDEIRELRDKVYVAPTSAKYKVYIIDEVHMLTREAFNALLKTLEEPPSHVVFILATTDAHKLPDTIISRTQRFNFKPAQSNGIVELLKDISKKEKINISDEALNLMAIHGDGSFRDSVSLLDQASHHTEKIEASDIQRLLGVPPAEVIEGLLTEIINGGETASLMKAITTLYDQGYQAAAIAKSLGQAIRAQLIANTIDQDSALDLLSSLIEVPISSEPERFLEITLLKAQPKTNNDKIAPPKKESLTEPIEKIPETKKEETEIIENTPPAITKPIEEDKKTPKPSKQKHASSLDDIWPEVLKALKQQHNTLYSVVRIAQPDFSEEGTLKLTFAFAFHQKRINDSANRQKIADIIEQLTGETLQIECLFDKNSTPPAINAKAVSELPEPDLAAISNIFGDAELLES